MYFCYGIKNSSLECAEGADVSRKNNECQQPIELSIPETRLKQTGLAMGRPTDAINKPNGFTSTLSSSYADSQDWQTFD